MTPSESDKPMRQWCAPEDLLLPANSPVLKASHGMKIVHVVEFSAYQAALESRDKWIKEINDWREATGMATPYGANEELGRIMKERDEWRTKALDVEKHPVVVALKAELEAQRDHSKILQQVIDASDKELTALRAKAEKLVVALIAERCHIIDNNKANSRCECLRCAALKDWSGGE